MTEQEFDTAFCEEFPDMIFIYDEWHTHDVELFSVYLVEHKFELIHQRNNHYGFDGDIYSDETDNFSKGNQYTFDFLVKNKDLLAFWLL